MAISTHAGMVPPLALAMASGSSRDEDQDSLPEDAKDYKKDNDANSGLLFALQLSIIQQSAQPAFMQSIENGTHRVFSWLENHGILSHDTAKKWDQSAQNLEQGIGRGTLKVEHAIASLFVPKNYAEGVAMIESSNNPLAHAAGTSAAGLDQFTEGTFIDTVQHGKFEGNDPASMKLRQAQEYLIHVKGRPTGEARDNILNLRYDRDSSNAVLKVFTANNEATVNAIVRKMAGQDAEQVLGRKMNGADLYMAHFLGPRDAARFLIAEKQNPNLLAQNYVSASAVEHNQNVFTNKKTGQPYTLGQVYARFDKFFPGTLPQAPEPSGHVAPEMDRIAKTQLASLIKSQDVSVNFHPDFAGKAMQVAQELTAKGYTFVISSGVRDEKEQANLRAQAGTAAVPQAAERSMHTYGLAADFAYRDGGHGSKQFYQDLGNAARKAGLTTGMDFNTVDKYHISIPKDQFMAGLDSGKYGRVAKQGTDRTQFAQALPAPTMGMSPAARGVAHHV